MIMHKKIIFQVNVPKYGPSDKLTAYTYIEDMYKVSEECARKYAKRCDADYYKVVVADDFKLCAAKHLDYQKLKAYDFLEYDQIIYFDSDYIIKDNAPNLFEVCGDKFSVCQDQGRSVADLAKELDMPIEKYFNAGFMHFTKNSLIKTKSFLPEYLTKEYTWDCQGFLNKLYHDKNIEFNMLPAHQWNNHRRVFGEYADHYSGAKKKKWNVSRYRS